ncbi:MAG TPA: RNA polymerase sigma factor, partial [Gaiellaceae bacterium]|nr:RNA polymerase sigma factor [Gaiellaceae bacterium]
MSAAPHMGRADQVTATTTQHLYERYGRQIYAYCLHQLRSREEAEDAVQTTFLNAFRSLKGGAVTHAEQAWLYKIAQNVCTARRSSAARRLRLETPNDFDVLQETIPAQNRESAVELIGLEDALEQMPENQRRAILLREWQGLSYREIGEQLELSQSSVEMLIFRARRTLAGALEQPAEEKKLKRKVGRTLNLGSVLAAIKSLLTGGAAVKAVALAVAAGAVSVTADAVQHTIVHSRQHRPAHNATTLSVAPQVAYSATSTPKAPVVSERPGSRVVKEQNAALTPRFDVQGTKARLAMDDVTVSPVATVVQATAPAPSSPQESTPPTTASKEQDAPSQSSGAASAPSAPAPAAPAKRQDGPSQPSSASSAPAPSTNNQTQTEEGNDKKRKQQDNAGDPAAAQPIVTTTTTTPTSTTTTPTSTTPAPSTDDPRNGKQKKND